MRSRWWPTGRRRAVVLRQGDSLSLLKWGKRFRYSRCGPRITIRGMQFDANTLAAIAALTGLLTAAATFVEKILPLAKSVARAWRALKAMRRRRRPSMQSALRQAKRSR